MDQGNNSIGDKKVVDLGSLEKQHKESSFAIDGMKTSHASTGASVTIEAVCRKISRELAALKDDQAKLNYVVECGKSGESLSEEERHDRYLVKGCISKAWLIADYKAGKIYLRGDSEALMVKGLMALLIKVYSGRNSEEILSVGVEYWQSIGLSSLLSMNRRSGVVHMLEQIRLCATTYRAIYEKSSL